MKLSIARSELLDALTVVSKGMSSRSTLPILSGILVSASNGSLNLQSTDLEVSVKHTVPCLVEDEGQTVVPGKLLNDIVRSLPEAAVTLETEGEMVAVRCQHSSFTFKTLKPADFPRFPEISVLKKIKLPSALLAAMVKRVGKAVSRDETRAVLTGVLVVVEGPSIRMVATDSYRLAVSEVILEQSPEEDMEVVVPGRALEEVTRIATSVDEVSLGITENQIVFEFGETTFVTRRIEGSFPNYKQLIPKEKSTSVEIVTEDFFSAVKRVSLMALHNSPLKISVSSEDQTLSLSANTQDVGDASEDLMVKVEGADTEIAFNHAFLTDGLNSITSETVTLEVQNALKPGLLRSRGDDDFLYLLMPVRLG
ncbi:MAG: DNA polymerase III subunit beta [Actinobacteria bacterium HGW-Actinobacteria-7]|jgi:DNA polymerase-3 subunit beta|nr:MAG: DNA polymerase III subunit beta [Actinobacteria bacterium HGW-Actinobacteria-7]